MKYCVALQSTGIPEVEHIAVQSIGIYPQVADGHRLKEHSHRFQVVHQIVWADPQGSSRDAGVDEIAGVGWLNGRFAT